MEKNMIEGLKGYFKKSDDLQDLEKRSLKFEQMLFDGINSLEGINKIYNKAIKVKEDESLKTKFTEEEHYTMSVDYATGQMTWNDLKAVADFAQELRKIYKDVYKKDAVTAASTNEVAVDAEKIKGTSFPSNIAMSNFGSQTIAVNQSQGHISSIPPSNGTYIVNASKEDVEP